MIVNNLLHNSKCSNVCCSLSLLTSSRVQRVVNRRSVVKRKIADRRVQQDSSVKAFWWCRMTSDIFIRTILHDLLHSKT